MTASGPIADCRLSVSIDRKPTIERLRSAFLYQKPKLRLRTQRVAQLRDHFVGLLEKNAPSFTLTAGHSQRHPGNLHGRFERTDADDLLERLQPNLFAATGSACTSGQTQHSHVLAAIGQGEFASEDIRFSLGRFTTTAEVEAAAELVAQHVEATAAAFRDRSVVMDPK